MPGSPTITFTSAADFVAYINANFYPNGTRIITGQMMNNILNGVDEIYQPKVSGKGLSTNDYTTTEKNKLATLSEHFVGVYASLAALTTANSTGLDGQYALIDSGSSAPANMAVWDSDDSGWNIVPGVGQVVTVNGLTGAVSLTTDTIPEGSTNKYFTTARTLATLLTGYARNATNRALAATDSILTAFGVLEKKIDDNTAIIGSNISAINGKEPTITASSNTTDYWNGAKAFVDFATSVRAAVLTGLSTATLTVILATDSVLVAIGKLQGQISAFAKAVAAEINTGTDDAKYITALGLAQSGYLTQSGTKISATAASATANVYTATITPSIAAYTTNQRFYITFTNANTAAATINLNGLGAKSLVKSGSTALASGDIAAGQTLILAYDGTNFQVIGLGGTAILKATTAEINTGTDDAKYVDPLQLQNSKYLTQDNTKISATATNTGNAFVAAFTPAISAVTANMRFFVKMPAAPTGAATLSVDGTAYPIKKNGGAAISGGEWKAGQILLFAYDGTNFQLIGRAIDAAVTTTQRDAIASPDTGALIFNTTTNILNYYNGTAWVAIVAPAIGTTITGASQGQIFYAGSGGTLQSDSTVMYVDYTNKRVGFALGTFSPSSMTESFNVGNGAGALAVSAGGTRGLGSQPHSITCYSQNGSYTLSVFASSQYQGFISDQDMVFAPNSVEVARFTNGCFSMNSAQQGNGGSVAMFYSTTRGVNLPRLTTTQRDAVNTGSFLPIGNWVTFGNTFTGGTGYNGGYSGTVYSVTFTGGSGSGATGYVSVSSGVITSVTITTGGSGYKLGDVLSATAAQLSGGNGGTGSGFTMTITNSFTDGLMIYNWTKKQHNFYNGTAWNGFVTTDVNDNATFNAAINVATGANKSAGFATLSAGTVTVSNTAITVNSIIMITRKTAGGTVGNLTYTVSAGTSFTINSDSATDTSVLGYLIIN